MTSTEINTLVDKLGSIVSNPANIFNRPVSTRNYIRLASRQAEKLLASGHKDEANSIWEAIAPYNDLLRGQNYGQYA